MDIIKAPKLNLGDSVGIVSPSHPVTNERRYRKSIRVLENLGFKVVVGKNALSSFGYKAGPTAERLEDLHAMFAEQKIRAIFSSAGGFSSLDLIPYLDYNLIKNNPKVFCGFSDIATLDNVIFKKTGLITFYNFSIEHFSERANDFTIKSFFDLLVHGQENYLWPQKSRWQVFVPGKARGRIIGGNLLTTANFLGFEGFSPDPKHDHVKYILCLEEHGTDFEELNNSLRRLGLYGIYRHLAGIVIGKMANFNRQGGSTQKIPPTTEAEFRLRPKPKNMTMSQLLTTIVKRFDINIPVVANVDFGYVKDKITIPIGVLAELNLSRHSSSIKLLESPVAL